MNEMKYTDDMWCIDETSGSATGVIRQARSTEIIGTCRGDKKSENARRIVACVNACVGIPNEVLEAPGWSIKEELDTLDRQIFLRMNAEERIGDLYTALKGMIEVFGDEFSEGESETVDIARAALCKSITHYPEQDVVKAKENHAEQHPGNCPEWDEPRYVTREMALDAGDPALEGTRY